MSLKPESLHRALLPSSVFSLGWFPPRVPEAAACQDAQGVTTRAGTKETPSSQTSCPSEVNLPHKSPKGLPSNFIGQNRDTFLCPNQQLVALDPVPKLWAEAPQMATHKEITVRQDVYDFQGKRSNPGHHMNRELTVPHSFHIRSHCIPGMISYLCEAVFAGCYNKKQALNENQAGW